MQYAYKFNSFMFECSIVFRYTENKSREIILICIIQHFDADFLWKVSLKILNSGIILKTFTHVFSPLDWGGQSNRQNSKLIDFFSSFSIKTYVVGTKKNPSQWDGSFEHPNHMLKIIGKKIFTILLRIFLFI